MPKTRVVVNSCFGVAVVPIGSQTCACIGHTPSSPDYVYTPVWAALNDMAGMILSSAMQKLLSEEFKVVVEQEQAVAPPSGHFHQHALLNHVIDQRCGSIGRRR